MWRRLVDWYRAWDEEHLAVLAQPELAAHVPAGFRRRHANRLAQLTPAQRQQLRAFALKYRGWRLAAALAALVAVFTLCGVLLHLSSPNVSWTGAILCANVVGFAFVIAAVSAWFDARRLSKEKGKLLVVVVSAVVLAASATTFATVWNGQPPTARLTRLSHLLSGMSVGMLAILVPVMVISILRNRYYETLNARLQQQAEQDRLARELSESQLRLLRAQIEPHFLFNTLGAVQQLAQHGAPRAAELTANLIDFLRSSMRDMRCEQVSLATEFALVESYLKVMQVRMGERLHYALALPRALEEVKLPSMILLTLAENAIKHGIEPSLRGGEVKLAARLDDGAIRIRVEDSGVGMSATPGAGTGLENVRSRLALAFGAASGLALQDGEPTGLVADITIPHTIA